MWVSWTWSCFNISWIILNLSQFMHAQGSLAWNAENYCFTFLFRCFKANIFSDRPKDAFGEYLRGDHDSKEEPKIEKEKPNFEPSGKLAEDTNTYRGVVIKYNEPPDAHLPKLRWRLYPFKVLYWFIFNPSLKSTGENISIIHLLLLKIVVLVLTC